LKKGMWIMKTFKVEVVYKDNNGRTKGKALFRVDADSPENAKEKLAAALVSDGPYEITEVKEA